MKITRSQTSFITTTALYRKLLSSGPNVLDMTRVSGFHVAFVRNIYL
jgi:hypothetical protein